MLKTSAWVPYAFVAPVLAIIGVIFVYPIIEVVNFSFRLIRGDSGPWVGFNNYRYVFEDPDFQAGLRHSIFLLLAVPLLVVVALLVSVILFEQVPGWRAYRVILFLPYIIAIPIIGIVFSNLLELHGPVNTFLEGVGLSGLSQDWLADQSIVMWSILGIIVWREVGFGILVFLARLGSLDESVLEAARIDGAGWWVRLRYVIVPELRGTIEFYIIVSMITMLAWVFGYVWTLTNGGPANASEVLDLYIYDQGITNSLPGMASAVAVMLLLASLVLISAVFRVRARVTGEVIR